jgi:hypothetical protein
MQILIRRMDVTVFFMSIPTIKFHWRVLSEHLSHHLEDSPCELQMVYGNILVFCCEGIPGRCKWPVFHIPQGT